jgi:hypothetical protein
MVCPARTSETLPSCLPLPTPQVDKFRKLSVPWLPKVWLVRLSFPTPALRACSTTRFIRAVNARVYTIVELCCQLLMWLGLHMQILARSAASDIRTSTGSARTAFSVYNPQPGRSKPFDKLRTGSVKRSRRPANLPSSYSSTSPLTRLRSERMGKNLPQDVRNCPNVVSIDLGFASKKVTSQRKNGEKLGSAVYKP